MPPIRIPVVILFVKQMNILRHAESVLEFIGWYELLSAKKRLLNLRTSWAVIAGGKATDAKWGWPRACSCGRGWWLNQRQRARRPSQNSVSSHRLLPLPEISAFSLTPQYVMLNINTSFELYLKQCFLCQAFSAASSLICVFLSLC